MSPVRNLPAQIAPDVPVLPSTTPRTLRRVQAAVALTMLLVGLVVFLTMNGLLAAASVAPQDTILYSRLSKVQASLRSATVTAQTSALSPESTRSTHSKQVMAQVSQAWDELLEAARERPESAESLKQIGQDILEYSFTLGSIAGANQSEAASVLPKAERQLTQLLDETDVLKQALASELKEDSSSLPVWATITVVLGLGVVIWASVRVARTTHRVFNLGLVGAGLGVVVMLLVAGGGQLTASALNAETRDDYLSKITLADDAAQAMGKAHLMVTTAVLQQSWSTSDASEYAEVYAAIKSGRSSLGLPTAKAFVPTGSLVTSISAGDWTAATTTLLSSSSSAPESTAEDYLTATTAEADDAVAATTEAGDGATRSIITQLVLTGLLALGAAAAAVFGLLSRIREYL